MTKETKSRSVRVKDYIAEVLEKEASHLPPSEAAKAEFLKNSANIMRDLGSPKVITILEN